LLGTKLIAVILSGGSGSRLWPLSRENHPKPFVRLKDDESLLQKAYKRALNLPNVIEILTVTNIRYIQQTIDHYEQINCGNKIDTRFVLEPEPRNTAAAICAAALDIDGRYKDEVIMVVLSADHLIKNEKAFRKIISKGVKCTKTNNHVLFGIKPTSPSTNFGYINVQGNSVISFKEKPSITQAKKFLNSRKYLWNAGMFCFKVSLLIHDLELHCKNIFLETRKALIKSHSSVIRNYSCLILNKSLFSLVESKSIDYALIEKTSNLFVIPCDVEWSDLGSWEAMSETLKISKNGNKFIGNCSFSKTKNTSIFAYSRHVALVGISDLIVVEMDDVILIVDKKSTQDIRQIYSQLKNEDNKIISDHNKVIRPWGFFNVLEEQKNFKVKKIVVNPYSCLSLQSHAHRSEHWVVIEGRAKIINKNEITNLRKNQSTYIPKNTKHQLTNPTKNILEIIEIQTGDYLGEDDIRRYGDKYGRN
jgi:mannose-1-phosphate guanylyltransferase/mannose-6-phosphate isomerase